MKMLRILRKEKNLTMKELGELVGVSESAISQYETGKREADFETLLKFGEILNCSVDFLLRGSVIEKTEKPTPVSEDGLDDLDKELTDFVKGLTKDQKKLLLAQMKTLYGQ